MKNYEQNTDHETLLLLVQDVKNIKEGQDSFHKTIEASLDRIEAQVIKTNGRVSELERWKSSSTGWTAGAGVGIMIILALVTYIFRSEVGTLSAQETETQALLTQHIYK